MNNIYLKKISVSNSKQGKKLQEKVWKNYHEIARQITFNTSINTMLAVEFIRIHLRDVIYDQIIYVIGEE